VSRPVAATRRLDQRAVGGRMGKAEGDLTHGTLGGRGFGTKGEHDDYIVATIVDGKHVIMPSRR